MEQVYHRDYKLKTRFESILEIMEYRGDHLDEGIVLNDWVLQRWSLETGCSALMFFNSEDSWCASLYQQSQDMAQIYGDVFSVRMHLIDKARFMRETKKFLIKYCI